MSELTQTRAYSMMGQKEIYGIVRRGMRDTEYYYTNLAEAVRKYDELCHRKNYYAIELFRFPVNGKYFREYVYTTQKNIVNAPYRNVSMRK